MASAKKSNTSTNQKRPAPNNKNPLISPTQRAQPVQLPVSAVNTITVETPRDSVIQQWREDYDRLVKTYQSLQQEYQIVVELNVDYTRIIAALQATIERNISIDAIPLSQNNNASNVEEVVQLQEKINELEKELKNLDFNFNSLKEKMKQVEKDREKLLADEQKIFVTLEMDINKATTDEAIMKLNELMKTKREKDAKEKPLHEKLNKIVDEMKNVKEKNDMFEREKSRLEFEIRQKNVTIKRLLSQKAVYPTIARANNVLTEAKELMRIATIRARGNGLPALLPEHPDFVGDSKSDSKKYCLFCRSECNSDPSENKCRLHYKAYRDKKWTCCENNGKDSHKSAGCITIPHCYVIKSAKALLLTDGQQFLLYE